MKKFPGTIYVTRAIQEEDTDSEYVDYFVDVSKSSLAEEEEDTEVAVYQLVKVGKVKKSSRIVFE